ncbi:unnamed protein product, partial [Prorocentrum cordatum]
EDPRGTFATDALLRGVSRSWGDNWSLAAAPAPAAVEAPAAEADVPDTTDADAADAKTKGGTAEAGSSPASQGTASRERRPSSSPQRRAAPPWPPTWPWRTCAWGNSCWRRAAAGRPGVRARARVPARGAGAAAGEFLRVVHELGQFRASPGHIVFVAAEGGRQDDAVQELRAGDVLLAAPLGLPPGAPRPSRVLSVGRGVSTAGMYAPLTASGTIVVDLEKKKLEIRDDVLFRSVGSQGSDIRISFRRSARVFGGRFAPPPAAPAPPLARWRHAGEGVQQRRSQKVRADLEATHRSLQAALCRFFQIPIYSKRLPTPTIEWLHRSRPPWGADGARSTFGALLPPASAYLFRPTGAVPGPLATRCSPRAAPGVPTPSSQGQPRSPETHSGGGPRGPPRPRRGRGRSAGRRGPDEAGAPEIRAPEGLRPCRLFFPCPWRPGLQLRGAPPGAAAAALAGAPGAAAGARRARAAPARAAG